MFIRKKDGTEIGRKIVDKDTYIPQKNRIEDNTIDEVKQEMYRYVDYIDIELYTKDKCTETTSNLYASYMDKLCVYLKNVCGLKKSRYRIIFNSAVDKLMIDVEGISYEYDDIYKDIEQQYRKISKKR